MKISGATKQTSAFSAQIEQSWWVQADVDALLEGIVHAFKDSALKFSLLVYIYPASLPILFNAVYFAGKKVYIHLALFPKLLEDTGHEGWKPLYILHVLPSIKTVSMLW